MGVRLSQPDFERALGYTAADLAANRAGRLSERQAAALRAEVPGNRSMMFGAGAVTLALAASSLLIYALADGGWWVMTAMFAAVGLLVTFVSWLGASEKRHLGKGKVGHQSGVLEIVGRKEDNHSYLRIDTNYYGLLKSQYDGLAKALAQAAGTHEAPLRPAMGGLTSLDLDGHYRIYFLVMDDGGSSRVLSIEHRDGPAAS
jgi:hypothetical protein